jgi:hypothetical protein
MESILVVLLIGVVAGLLIRRSPPTQPSPIIYVQPEAPAPEHSLGCLPLVLIVLLVLTVLGVIQL